MPKGYPLTEQELALKRQEIARTAAELILQQGFTETSVSQIAARTGMGKSTLYDYFSSKDEIILLLLDEPLAEVRSRARQIAAESISVEARLMKILDMHLEVLSRDKAMIFKLSYEFQRLPLPVQARHQVRRQEYQDQLQDLVREGVEQGIFREVDPDMAVRTLLTLLSTVLLTPTPRGTPRDMLREGLDLLLLGIKVRKKEDQHP